MSEPARQQIAPVRESQVVQADASTIMDVIARAASDPNMDVEKLTRLADLYERINDRSAEAAYNDAMNAAQEAMRPIAADANNPQTKSKYASYAALDRALRPIYTKHGFSISFDTGDCDKAETVRVVAKVGHVAGHKERPHLDMPADGKGAKGGDVMTKTHAIGAAVTYGKRYLLGMIFNIAVGEPSLDDDGNGNGGPADGRGMSQAAQDAIAEINSYDDAAGLVLWKKNKAAAVEKAVSLPEWNVIVRLWNKRSEALKAARADG